MLHPFSQDEVSLKTSSHWRLIFTWKMVARSLFNTPTTQLWHATGTNSLVQLDTSLESGNGIGEPVTTFLEALSGSACLRCLQTRLSPTAKGPVPQPPQEHPSEGQLWVRYGTGLHRETPGSFSLLGYLVLFSTAARMATSWTQHQHCYVVQGTVSKGPSDTLQPNFKISGYSSKRCPGGKAVLLLAALWLYLVILASSVLRLAPSPTTPEVWLLQQTAQGQEELHHEQ